jgi:hypothetical protein
MAISVPSDNVRDQTTLDRDLAAATEAWAATICNVARARGLAPLAERCSCGHLAFVHSENEEPFGSCFFNGCPCVKDTGARW